MNRRRLQRAPEILGLYACAVAQPLFDLLQRSVPLLIHHRVDTIDLWLLAGLLGVALPGLLVTTEALAGALLGDRFQDRFHAALSALLITLFVLAALRSVGGSLPGVFALTGAAILGLGGSWAMECRPALRLFPSILAIGLPLSMILFLWAPAVVGLRVSDSDQLPETPHQVGAAPTSDIPIVFVVFDELPLLSLLDDKGAIDASAFPHFAALTEHGTWYRNATTVWSHTSHSLTSMLTGNVATLEQAPTRAEYPNNLLNWLAGSHALVFKEHVTKLGPPVARDLTPTPPRLHRSKALWKDLWIVYPHLVLPPQWSAALVPIGSRWGDFAEAVPAAVVSTDVPDMDPSSSTAPPWAFALLNPRAQAFADFLESLHSFDEGAKPKFYFLHSMVPHLPARYLPSGKVYGGRPVYLPVATAWLDDEAFVREVYQRHLMQVAYVDRLLGQLVDRLRELGLYDRALLVVTSDHGASHWLHQGRREPLATEHPQDIWRIPLLIKAPFQNIGRVDDRNVQSIDILPTIADLLELSLPFAVEGSSAVDPKFKPAALKVIHEPGGGVLEMPGEFHLDTASLERKLELFDPAAGVYRWVRHGPHRELVGRQVEEVPQDEAASGCRVELDQLPVLRIYDPAQKYAPVQWTGSLHCADEHRIDTETGALALVTHGRIQGIAAVRRVPDGAFLFSGFIPEEVLTPGENAAELFLIFREQENGPLGLRVVGLVESPD